MSGEKEGRVQAVSNRELFIRFSFMGSAFSARRKGVSETVLAEKLSAVRAIPARKGLL